MIVRLAFWLATRLQNVVMRLLDYGCRHSNPPVDLATEMGKQLAAMTTVYVVSPTEAYGADPDTGIHAATKH
jgi:7-cyano-7-deazaguanine synthase in queuosine biosynthesis